MIRTRKLLSAPLIFLIFTSCAQFVKDTQVTLPPPIKAAAEEPAHAEKELGSLWSDTSKWNEFYARRSDRTIGDLIVLYPSDSFRLSVANHGGHQAAEVTAADRTNSHIVAKITDILPQHTYAVTAKQTLRVGTRSHEISFLGKLREQDIGSDDSSSTDLVFDSQLDVKDDGKKADEKKNETPVVAMKKPFQDEQEKKTSPEASEQTK